MTGNLLNCYHPFEFSVVGVAQWLIRKLTGGADHTAILMESVGEVHVIEASYPLGGVVMLDWDEWNKLHKGVRYTISKPIYEGFDERRFKHTLKGQIGLKYDLKAVLWDMVLLLGTKKWFGSTDNGKADERFFCSELAMYVHKRDNWFRMMPVDIENHPDFVNDRDYVTTR